MTDSKTYLNVPFAQKDAAKALGARWDAANKKWYVPADKDVSLFAQWQTDATVQALSSASSKSTTPASSSNNSSSVNHASPGAKTHPADKNFVAYDGDAPPWA